MRYVLVIDQIRSLEWGLTTSEAIMFSFLYSVPSWAEQIHTQGQTWYFASRNKVVAELPLLTDKPDTIYKLYKSLQAKGVIEWIKFCGKDCIRLTDKAKTWNTSTSELGKKSEQTRKIFRKNSEKNPTNNYNNNNQLQVNNYKAKIKIHE